MLTIVLILTLSTLLHTEGVQGTTFEELKNALPISVHPFTNDKYLFFMVPIEKFLDDDMVIRVGQFQKNAKYGDINNTIIAATVNGSGIAGINGSEALVINGEADYSNILAELSNPDEHGDEDAAVFNFQVPVIVPLNFEFHDDEPNSSLPTCTEDIRTWQEQTITTVTTHLGLKVCQEWEEHDSALLMRLLKDELVSMATDRLDNITILEFIVNKIQELHTLADKRFGQVLSNIQKLTGDHLALVAEGWDTYALLLIKINVAVKSVNDDHDQNSNRVKLLLDSITAAGNSVNTTLSFFNEAYAAVEVMREEQLQG